jgi:catechol 2,3-dioxygenase-like lactoylglutathione lyase family enzyme
MTIEFGRAVPTFRIFSLEKAREFYFDFLGFKMDWEHQFAPDLPVYMQISRGDLIIHLSEHYGDGTPGSTVLVHMNGIEELHRELIGKQYRHARPGLEKREWGVTQVVLTDPFGNRIVFNEPTDKSAA